MRDISFPKSSITSNSNNVVTTNGGTVNTQSSQYQNKINTAIANNQEQIVL